MSEPAPQYTAIAVAVGMFALLFCVGMAALGWSASRAAREQGLADLGRASSPEEQQREREDATREIEKIRRQMDQDAQEYAQAQQAGDKADEKADEKAVPPDDPPSPTALPADGAVAGQGGDITILGSLTADLITPVIKRNMSHLRYCYQRELTKDPDLAGKVTVKFIISGKGSVDAAKVDASTLGSAAVESCIAGRFMRFQFPEPKGGGIVVVRYPLVFSPG